MDTRVIIGAMGITILALAMLLPVVSMAYVGVGGNGGIIKPSPPKGYKGPIYIPQVIKPIGGGGGSPPIGSNGGPIVIYQPMPGGGYAGHGGPGIQPPPPGSTGGSGSQGSTTTTTETYTYTTTSSYTVIEGTKSYLVWVMMKPQGQCSSGLCMLNQLSKYLIGPLTGQYGNEKGFPSSTYIPADVALFYYTGFGLTQNLVTNIYYHTYTIIHEYTIIITNTTRTIIINSGGGGVLNPRSINLTAYFIGYPIIYNYYNIYNYTTPPIIINGGTVTQVNNFIPDLVRGILWIDSGIADAIGDLVNYIDPNAAQYWYILSGLFQAAANNVETWWNNVTINS